MKIGIVNDLPIAVEMLRRVLSLQPEHQVIWVANDGEQAVDLCAWQTPDLVLMDLVMPSMDGVEATRRIMKQTPCAILIVTVDVGVNAGRVYAAMGHGALDAVDTPALLNGDLNKSAAPLLAKINAIGKLVSALPGKLNIAKKTPAVMADASSSLVTIGASAGGPAALATVLRRLPANFPAAVVVIQHIDAAFAAGMADWLNQQSALPVRLAKEGDQAVAGTVLVAGTNHHLLLKSADKFGYAPGAVDDLYQPSIDVLFQSVVQLWRGKAVGVLLTGMGRDGAIGLKAMRNKGYHTIAQDRKSSAVYGMPKAAATLDAAVDILPVGLIAQKLISVFA
ncbi:chemotaxis response regulator protein-glutamate methylesterase [Undibacterium arcticum]|uniref:Protein-glutamate methylesterase/protein-glutamine glutaminase n=1 Tax=Undibacterium arcticum TaxID=1762892 RepID=A0ABV7F2H1_9BURK